MVLTEIEVRWSPRSQNRIAYGEDSWPSFHMCFYRYDHTLFLSAIVLR